MGWERTNEREYLPYWCKVTARAIKMKSDFVCNV